MGKYLKKGKINGDVAVMEIPSSSSSSSGVRTRARTLALQPNPDLSFLQLRSRRLLKPPPPPPPPQGSVKNPSNNSDNPGSKVRVDSAGGSKGRFGHSTCVAADSEELSTVEASFGENNFEFDSRERSTRESTPCSLIRDSETIGTPGSTTRPTCSTASNRRARNNHRTIPTNPEMEEFFAGYEHNQQKLFIEKYNYDFKNDVPLPGRYEWVKVD